MRVTVIGLGLIGGSIALAARGRADAQTSGWDPDPSVCARALARGALCFASGSLEDAVKQAQAVFVAAPVSALAQSVAAVLAAAPADCVVSDVGSTKREVLAGQHDPRFLGGHPLAGAESSGIEHARADLFDGASWYLTPTESTEGLLYERLYRLLAQFGAHPEAIDADTHDRLLAHVSHLPHVFANVLVAQALAARRDDEKRLPVAGPSFRDATRVAGANSAIWTDIYLSNADALVPALDDAIARLAAVREALRRRDPLAITRWNDAAAADRRALSAAHPSTAALEELRVGVPNRPGVVAQLALELGRAGVNIVDMALYPAPDMSEGVVAIWVAGEPNAARAQALIAGLGFEAARP